MRKRLLYLTLALCGAPLLWGQSTVVCTTASPGTVIGSCASGASDPLSLANITGTTSNCGGAASGAANSVCLSSNAATFEGATADGFETVLAGGDATADNTLTLKGTASGVEATVTTGSLLTGAGTGTGRVSVGGVLCKGAPSLATTSVTEQALATCQIPANTLTAAGSRLRISFSGQTAANGNNKTVYVRIGATGTCPGTCALVYQSLTAGLSNQDVYSLVTEAVYKSSTKGVLRGLAQYITDASAASSSAYGGYMNRDGSVDWTSALEVTISALTPNLGDFTLLEWVVEAVQ